MTGAGRSGHLAWRPSARREFAQHLVEDRQPFGDFRFELFTYLGNSANTRGQLLATWDVSLMDPKANLLHWDKITSTYKFKLQWDQPIPVGRRFVLAAVLASPYAERQFAQRVFISGQ